ncbi:MAG: hypothetical protein QM692_01635 [Thermomicrobiales bacterium]
MTSPTQPDPSPNVVPLFPGEEQAATELAHYWDATVQGRATGREVDPELVPIIQLLRHYQGAVAPPPPEPPPPPRARAASLALAWQRSLRQVALALAVVAAVAFTVNTAVSPRSWLLSSAADPDWLPLVSDDWLAEAPAVRLLDPITAVVQELQGVDPHGA